MIKLLYAEIQKTRKICYVVPVVSSIILILFTCLEWYIYFRQGAGGIMSGLNVVYMFLSFTMLLTISIMCSIVSETEHQAQGLKLFFTMPVSRTAFYVIKAVWVIILMIICSTLILSGFSVVWIMYSNETLPFLFLAKQIFGCLAASLPVLSIQLFISMYFYNQTFPLAFGVTGAVSSLFLPRIIQKGLYIFPWAYPSMASPFIKEYILWIILGLGIGVIFLIAGAVKFRNLEIK